MGTRSSRGKKVGAGEAAAADPGPGWSWDTPLSKQWKRPGKEEFFRRFAVPGDVGIRDARERYCDGTIPGKETKGVVGTPEAREVRIWRPGDLEGYDLNLEGLRHVDYYVLDVSGQLTVEDCEDVRLFVAPCEGSVSLRACKGCLVAVACGQLRMRDCDGCTVMALVPGRLNVESCRGTRAACWHASYFLIAEQLAKARLSAFNNGWFRSHDFGTNSAVEHLPTSTTMQEMMGAGWRHPGELEPRLSDFCSGGGGGIVPVVAGWQDGFIAEGDGGGPADGGLCFALFSGRAAAAAAGVCAAAPPAGASVIAAREERICPMGWDPLRCDAAAALVPSGLPEVASLRNYFCRGPAVGVAVRGWAREGVRAAIEARGLFVIEPDAADVVLGAAEFDRGLALLWAGEAALAPATHFTETLRHGLDG